MIYRDRNGIEKTHRHRWATIMVCSRGTLTQKCECKAVPQCQTIRQIDPDGHHLKSRVRPSMRGRKRQLIMNR